LHLDSRKGGDGYLDNRVGVCVDILLFLSDNVAVAFGAFPFSGAAYFDSYSFGSMSVVVIHH
jgi:hypothetical protein